MGISLPNRWFNSLLLTFTPQKRCRSFNSPKPVNKTRSMVPSESLLSIPPLNVFQCSYTFLLQPPLFSCTCSFLSSAYFHTFILIYSRDLTIFPHFPWLTPTCLFYLLVLWFWLKCLGAADNSDVFPFTFSQSMAITFGYIFSDIHP